MIFNFVVSKEVCILYASLNLVGVRREFAKIDTIPGPSAGLKIEGRGVVVRWAQSAPPYHQIEIGVTYLPKSRGGGDCLIGSDGPAFSKELS